MRQTAVPTSLVQSSEASAAYCHFFLALVLSTDAILVLLHGAGLGGSFVTGLFLVTTTAMLFSLGNWSRFLFHGLDGLFVLFVISVGISSALNGHTAGKKETALLLISLASYPAGRLIPRGTLSPVFVLTILPIVAVGLIVTLQALYAQWGDQMSKPVVFGYNHAATSFLTACGFALLSLAARDLNERRVKVICALFALPSFVFAVSMVRFGFVALTAGLYAAARSTQPKQRRYVYTIMAVVISAALAGSMTRYETWATLGGYIISNAKSSETVPWTPRSECGVIVNDSLGVRAVLWRDAVRAIPSVGYFGLGLGNYNDVSCFKETPPHNVVLQALIEFGWVGGLALALLIVAAIASSWRPAQHHDEARFVLCSLIYVVLTSLVHGSVSNAPLLFLFLGYASRIYEDGFFEHYSLTPST